MRVDIVNYLALCAGFTKARIHADHGGKHGCPQFARQHIQNLSTGSGTPIIHGGKSSVTNGRGKSLIQRADGVKQQHQPVQGQEIRLNWDNEQIGCNQGIRHNQPHMGRTSPAEHNRISRAGRQEPA